MDTDALATLLKNARNSENSVRALAEKKYADQSPETINAMFIHQLTEPIAVFLRDQPELSGNPMLRDGTGSATSLRMLLPRALWLPTTRTSAASAVKWLKKIMAM